jgi:hypothetical protein
LTADVYRFSVIDICIVCIIERLPPDLVMGVTVQGCEVKLVSELLLSGKLLRRNIKFRLNPSLGIQPFWLSLLSRQNNITLGKSTHFFGQPVYGQLIKCLDKAKILQMS